MDDQPGPGRPAREPDARTARGRFGKRLRALRRRKGLSGRKAAAACGVSSAMWYEVEAGTHSPTLEVLQRIAKGMNVSLERMLRGME